MCWLYVDKQHNIKITNILFKRLYSWMCFYCKILNLKCIWKFPIFIRCSWVPLFPSYQQREHWVRNSEKNNRTFIHRRIYKEIGEIILDLKITFSLTNFKLLSKSLLILRANEKPITAIAKYRVCLLAVINKGFFILETNNSRTGYSI